MTTAQRIAQMFEKGKIEIECMNNGSFYG
jgi:hypothetical protein